MVGGVVKRIIKEVVGGVVKRVVGGVIKGGLEVLSIK